MIPSPIIRDDFAGPGGWEEGLRILREQGIQHPRCIGVEYEPNAVATAHAAGQERLHADVRDLPATILPTLGFILAGYIASPPCQPFSAAGKGEGRKHLAALRTAATFVAEGMDPATAIAAVQDDELDERSLLVLHPLTVIRDAQPPWVALEQVPQVLPIWETYAEILREEWGYSVRTGYVHAEEYGVPQTRKRAILVAVKDGEAPWPTKTHSRFHVRDRARLDPGYPKWISMAESLEWGMTERPSMTVTGGGTETGGAEPFGNAARQGMLKERDAGDWIWDGPGGVDPETPATTVCGDPRITARSHHNPGEQGRNAVKSADVRAAYEGGPTPAIEGETVDDVQWVHDRPSPTIVGSYHPEVVAKPGYRKAGDPPRQKTPGSVRITVEEAGILQSFPADYPWQGKQGKQFQQVGNAIPPLLAAAILRPLLERV